MKVLLEPLQNYLLFVKAQCVLKSAAPQNNGRNYAITELCWIGKLHVSELGGANYSKCFPKITQSAILHTAGRRETRGGDAAVVLRRCAGAAPSCWQHGARPRTHGHGAFQHPAPRAANPSPTEPPLLKMAKTRAEHCPWRLLIPWMVRYYQLINWCARLQLRKGADTSKDQSSECLWLF